MHEMSIVKSIIAIAEEEAVKANVNSFSSIELEIGTIAGIEFDALNFVWKIAVKNTILEKATMHITKINAKAACENCKAIFPIQFIHDSCGKCGSFQKKIIQGKELRIKSLET